MDRPNKRALMVADMTTFMARLVNKLCETSANQINSLIQAN
jgi:hypothetical protein